MTPAPPLPAPPLRCFATIYYVAEGQMGPYWFIRQPTAHGGNWFAHGESIIAETKELKMWTDNKGNPHPCNDAAAVKLIRAAHERGSNG